MLTEYCCSNALLFRFAVHCPFCCRRDHPGFKKLLTSVHESTQRHGIFDQLWYALAAFRQWIATTWDKSKVPLDGAIFQLPKNSISESIFKVDAKSTISSLRYRSAGVPGNRRFKFYSSDEKILPMFHLSFIRWTFGSVLPVSWNMVPPNIPKISKGEIPWSEIEAPVKSSQHRSAYQGRSPREI